jgi:hypothetical protein
MLERKAICSMIEIKPSLKYSEIQDKPKDRTRKMFVPLISLITEMRTKNLPLHHGVGYKIRGVDG